MSGADNLLQIAQLRGGYSEVDIIHGIDLAVAPGEIVTIAGTNGAGKSTHHPPGWARHHGLVGRRPL